MLNVCETLVVTGIRFHVLQENCKVYLGFQIEMIMRVIPFYVNHFSSYSKLTSETLS